MIRRINLFGGPGCGKSTLAARVYAELKAKGVKVELAREWIKQWAYERRELSYWEQLYCVSNQLYEEDKVLQHVDVVVTDSPIMLGVYHTIKKGRGYWEALAKISDIFRYDYPEVNFVLRRTKKYEGIGRWESEEEARALDEDLRDFIAMYGIPFTEIDYTDYYSVIKAYEESM